ncbi:MAG: hypothetical protein JWQ20_2629 [Conexibacter sp.]|nr:hypothetical protein [Conexibacter sp.]
MRSVRYRRGLLTFTFKNKPKGVQARVQIFARKKGRAFPTLTRSLHVTGDATIRRGAFRLTFTLSQTIAKTRTATVSVAYPGDRDTRSQTRTVNLRAR